MAIQEKELKLLWGKAAGRCSYCNEDLTRTYDTGSITLGEMAHVIARSEKGPRGNEVFLAADKRDKYSNLILLCPTHHTMIDKAPENFSVQQIISWKEEHEEKIRIALTEIKLESTKELFEKVAPILLENSQIHKQYGPESLVANRNPLSEVADIWTVKKLTKLIPNNKKIINVIESNINLLIYKQQEIFYGFKEHAEAFEMNALGRLDREVVPVFPLTFKKMIEEGLES
ncbi:HNH endonuclease signature motif containing protein [Sporosarcina sp. FSL K6-3508]|uniref:HNH endonuclease signature motif containing protein n=1 Tax=Sporosarcina sp. FSL K6-3508 TaxID=2921557 RepID=UPI00315AA2B7